MVHHLLARGANAAYALGGRTACLDDLLTSDPNLQAGLEHARRPGHVDLARRSRDLGHRGLAEPSDSEQGLGRGGEDGPDGGDVGVLQFVDLGHLDAGVGQLFHGLVWGSRWDGEGWYVASTGAPTRNGACDGHARLCGGRWHPSTGVPICASVWKHYYVEVAYCLHIIIG